MKSPQDRIRRFSEEELLDLMQSLELSLVEADGFHFVDDDEFLDRWSNGDLTEAERHQLADHLAGCPDCRAILNEMIQEGVFLPPSDSAGTAEHEYNASSMVTLPPEQRNHSASVSESSARLVVATVVCCLLAVIGYFSMNGDRDGTPELAQADYGYLTRYLTEDEYDDIAGWGKGDGPLKVKGDDVRTLRLRRIARDVDRNPDNITLRLDYGRLLFDEGRVAGEDSPNAEEQFVRALELDSTSPLAWLGIGMVQFRTDRVEEAEQTFRSLLKEDQVVDAARLNLVVCLTKLKRLAEAKELWKLLPEKAKSEDLEIILYPPED